MSPNLHVTFKEVEEVLRGNNRFIIMSHMRPDGDAIGSSIAMGEALKQLGKEVTILNEDGVPHNLLFMKGSAEVSATPDAALEADVLISLDNGSWKRLGDRSIKAVAKIPFCLNIDHHETNDCYGDMCCIMPDKSSTGEILYGLFRSMNIALNPVMRDAIYVAVSTDTGSFQYDRTTPEVMEMAAELIRQGVNVHEINRKLYQETSWNKLMSLREILNNLKLTDDGLVAYSSISYGRKAELGIGDEDTEGMIDMVRSVNGVVLAAFFEEQEDGRIRVSLRSKDRDISINDIAAGFGGGGHALAAGIRMRTSLDEARQKVLGALNQKLNHLR